MRTWAVNVVAAAVVASSVSAQSPELQHVDSLIATGQIASARGALQSWWDRSWDDADRTDTQRALWLRGRLTVDPDMAALDYRRLIIEHPAGPFSADAHLRLGQSALARGDAAVAARHFQSVIRDYPSSPARRHASRLMERLGTAAASQPELQGRFAIQLGAFFDDQRADELYRRATEEGLKARRVRVDGDDLKRVRVGWFGSREAAEISVEAVRKLGFEATVVSNGDREVEIGG